MKKLFIAIITDVEGIQVPVVYYIRATDYFAAEALAHEITFENGRFDSKEDMFDEFDFDIREFDESEIIEA